MTPSPHFARGRRILIMIWSSSPRCVDNLSLLLLHTKGMFLFVSKFSFVTTANGNTSV